MLQSSSLWISLLFVIFWLRYEHSCCHFNHLSHFNRPLNPWTDPEWTFQQTPKRTPKRPAKRTSKYTPVHRPPNRPSNRLPNRIPKRPPNRPLNELPNGPQTDSWTEPRMDPQTEHWTDSQMDPKQTPGRKGKVNREDEDNEDMNEPGLTMSLILGHSGRTQWRNRGKHFCHTQHICLSHSTQSYVALNLNALSRTMCLDYLFNWSTMEVG